MVTCPFWKPGRAQRTTEGSDLQELTLACTRSYATGNLGEEGQGRGQSRGLRTLARAKPVPQCPLQQSLILGPWAALKKKIRLPGLRMQVTGTQLDL